MAARFLLALLALNAAAEHESATGYAERWPQPAPALSKK